MSAFNVFNNDDDDDFDEADYASFGSFSEIREEVDSSNKVVNSEVVDLSKQLDHFQRVIESTSARSDTDRKGSVSKAKKQQELIDKMRESLQVENSIDEVAAKDPHFKFVKEIADLRDQAQRNMKKSTLKTTESNVNEQESHIDKTNMEEVVEDVDDVGDDLDFLDTLLSREEEARESEERKEYAVAKEAAKQRALDKASKAVEVTEKDLEYKSVQKKNNGFGAGFKKGFLSKSSNNGDSGSSSSSSSSKPPSKENKNVTDSTTFSTNTRNDSNISDDNGNNDANSSSSSSSRKGDSGSNSNDNTDKPITEGTSIFPDVKKMTINEIRRELEILKDVPTEPSPKNLPFNAQVVERDSIDMRNAEIIDWDAIKKNHDSTDNKISAINENSNQQQQQDVSKSKPRSIFAQQMIDKKTASSTFAKPK